MAKYHRRINRWDSGVAFGDGLCHCFGVKPEQGIYTAIVAGIVAGIFGGSRVQIAGPTGAFIVILASITAQYGFTGLQMATSLPELYCW